uniref:Bm10663 n=1 Tax=Brugia malayi TaxID=6279 RepID=A0A1I9G758_BRUMA|nr:Bm10663 [Brugia malayi]
MRCVDVYEVCRIGTRDRDSVLPKAIDGAAIGIDDDGVDDDDNNNDDNVAVNDDDNNREGFCGNGFAIETCDIGLSC